MNVVNEDNMNAVNEDKMTEINIPSITVDTPIPYVLNLRATGQPLEKLHLREYFVRLTRVFIRERLSRRHDGGIVGYTVETVGLSPQTKREKQFGVEEREEMVTYVNTWIAKTVAAGLKKMAEVKAEQNERERQRNQWIAEQIEKAGGIEERRQQILREAYDLAAREAMQYESTDVYGAIMTALITRSPITIDPNTRDKIIKRYEENTKTSWTVKEYIDARTQDLDKYLSKTQQEGI